MASLRAPGKEGKETDSCNLRVCQLRRRCLCRRRARAGL